MCPLIEPLSFVLLPSNAVQERGIDVEQIEVEAHRLIRRPDAQRRQLQRQRSGQRRFALSQSGAGVGEHQRRAAQLALRRTPKRPRCRTPARRSRRNRRRTTARASCRRSAASIRTNRLPERERARADRRDAASRWSPRAPASRVCSAGASPKRSGRGGLQARRDELRAVDRDARAARVQRDVRGVERQRSERSAVDARVAARRERADSARSASRHRRPGPSPAPLENRARGPTATGRDLRPNAVRS